MTDYIRVDYNGMTNDEFEDYLVAVVESLSAAEIVNLVGDELQEKLNNEVLDKWAEDVGYERAKKKFLDALEATKKHWENVTARQQIGHPCPLCELVKGNCRVCPVQRECDELVSNEPDMSLEQLREYAFQEIERIKEEVS